MNKIFISALIFLLILSGCSKNEIVLMYVGTYSDGKSEGIYSYFFDQETGKLEFANVTPNQEDPSFLEISLDKQYLYVVAETIEGSVIDSGSVSSYKILKDGKLEKINNESTKGYHPCHVAVSPNGELVVASNYRSGSLSLYRTENGVLSESFQLIQHEGLGLDSSRQEGPHAHSALFDAEGKYLVSADLGTDKIDFYEQGADGKFVPTDQAFISMKPGAGPRHFAFSPDNQFIYVMNELNATVTVLKKEVNEFVLQETVSALPEGYKGAKSGADIHVSKDGRFVYSSNRGHNSIAVFKRDVETGKIQLQETESVQGDWPRNFALSPNGEFLLVANQHSNNISVLKINEKGNLDYTGNSVEVPSPVCLKFLVK